MTTGSKKKFFRLANRLGYMPSYIFAQLDAEKFKLREKGVDVIELSLGSPDLPSPESVIKACEKVLRDPENYRYPPFWGQTKFKQAAAEWIQKRFSVEVDPETEVFPLSGSKEGLAHLALALIDPGDVVIVPSPYYPAHARGTLLAGGSNYELPLLEKNKYLPDLDSIPQDILDKAKTFFISYPNNPTGATCDIELYEKLVHLCTKNEILLISDLAYSELTFDGYKAPSVLQVKGAKDIAIEFHSFSKTYSMAGWRIGFVVGNQDLIKAMYEIKTHTDYGVCNITQAASISALQIPLEEHDKTRAIYKERRDVMLEGVTQLGWNIPKPKGAMYIWLPVPKQYKTSLEFCSAMLEKAHIATIPGGSFGTYGEGYLRIALVDNKDRLKVAIKRMKEAGIYYK